MKWALLGFGLLDVVFWDWVDHFDATGEVYTLFDLPRGEAERVYESMKKGCRERGGALPCLLLRRVDLLRQLRVYKLPLGFMVASWGPFYFVKRGSREAALYPLFFLASLVALAREKKEYLKSYAAALDLAVEEADAF